MDPLSVFREFVQQGQLDQVEVDAKEGKVRFADKYSFPASAATAFRREGAPGQYYPLAVVVGFYKWHVAGEAAPDYIRKFPDRKDQVNFIDREDLASYLRGEAATFRQLDENVPLIPFEPPAKRQKVGGEADALQHLFSHEKQLRDRNSLLCAPGADFRPVLAMVDRVMAARRDVDARAAAAAKAAPGKPGAPQHRPGHPQQPQQKPATFIKASGRGDREVDTAGTIAAMGVDKGVAAQLGLGYGMQPAAPVHKPRSSSSAAAAAAAQQKGGKGGDPRTAAAAAALAGRPPSASQKGSGKLAPIILVPSGYSALVNLYNAKQLLEEHKFVPSAEIQAQLAAKNELKPKTPMDFLRSARREGAHKPRYEITDKVPKQGHPDWKRVVAVIVQGKAWQFKEFPFKGAAQGDMVDTFSNIFGAFFYYKDDKVPEAVNGWKVVKLPLRRDVRHLDNQVVMEFYDKLDAFLTSMRRSDLYY